MRGDLDFQFLAECVKSPIITCSLAVTSTSHLSPVNEDADNFLRIVSDTDRLRNCTSTGTQEGCL